MNLVRMLGQLDYQYFEFERVRKVFRLKGEFDLIRYLLVYQKSERG